MAQTDKLLYTAKVHIVGVETARRTEMMAAWM
jgi:hypothetical protein